MLELVKRFELLRAADDELPQPGGGRTAERHRLLLELGRDDLSFARIAEGHGDALAILREAQAPRRPGELYAVWASDGPGAAVAAHRLGNGHWQLRGTKQYCSGAAFVSRALVTAHRGTDVVLFDVPLDRRGIEILPSAWATPAMQDTATGPVAFDMTLPPRALVGHEGWYLQRPGFWHGALGPAACWAGGAVSLVEAAAVLNRKDAHSRAQVGAMQAAAWGMRAVLHQAGDEIDADPLDLHGGARRRALKVRHLIERWCTEIMDRFGRATGPQLLAYDRTVARQHMALALYIRQCHAERDAATIPD